MFKGHSPYPCPQPQHEAPDPAEPKKHLMPLHPKKSWILLHPNTTSLMPCCFLLPTWLLSTLSPFPSCSRLQPLLLSPGPPDPHKPS